MRQHETAAGFGLPRTALAVEAVTQALHEALPGPPLAVLMADLVSAGTDWQAPGVDGDAVLADAVRDTGLSLPALDQAMGVAAGDSRDEPPCELYVLASVMLRRVHLEDASARGLRGRGPETGARMLARALVMVSRYLLPWAAPESWVREPERREELCRLFLAGMGLVPRGEDEATALAAWESVSALAGAEAAEELRTEELRRAELAEALARKRAAEAAARYVGY